MRRADKEIKDRKTIEWILKKALFCKIALSRDNKPYIIPMNFGFKSNSLYLHSAPEGKKIEILKKNPQICFEVDIKTEIVTSNNPCNWGMRFYSVIGFGKACIIRDNEGKRKALDVIMDKYTGGKSFEYSEDDFNQLIIIKVEITDLTGKKSGY